MGIGARIKTPYYRMFDGKRYERESRHNTRSGAIYAAQALRARGMLARVAAGPGEWTSVWVRSGYKDKKK